MRCDEHVPVTPEQRVVERCLVIVEPDARTTVEDA